MPDESARYLGFAFASADLLFEIAPNGQVAFALGAAQAVAGVEAVDLKGGSWSELFSPDDAAVVETLLASLEPGERRGPVRVGLKPRPGRALSRYAALSVCRLPQLGGAVSCALSLSAPPPPAQPQPSGRHGLYDGEGFAAMASGLVGRASETGVKLNMAMVELDGLDAAARAMPEPQAEKVRGAVAAALKAESYEGSAAAQVEADRFALVRRDQDGDSERLAVRLTKAVAALGLDIRPRVDAVVLDPEAPGDSLKTLKLALERFMAGGDGDFAGVVRRTAMEASQFRAAVASRSFTLAYQPIVELATGRCHHFEALVRLGSKDSPADKIQMAEALDLIQDLDLAVVQSVCGVLARPGRERARIAANISARSLMAPDFVDRLIKAARGPGPGQGRLILEITESSAISDLAEANRRVQVLRRRGWPVCLDDFGAGAASFDYLRAVAVDQVKIDGRYVKDLAVGGRDAVLVRHLAGLCRELGVKTVGEMVETAEAAETLKAIGVDYAQGYLYGRPAAEPVYAPAAPRAATPARRTGVVESWG